MYTKEKLDRILAENDFKEYEFVVMCSGEKRSSIDKEHFINFIISSGEYEGIDEDLIPILIELNEKGYKTSMSCSGHLAQIESIGRYESYLAFENPYDFKPLPPRYSKTTGQTYYWYGDKNGSIEEKENDRKRLMEELLEWAKRLKECDWIEKDYAKDGWIYLNGEKTFEYQD